MFLGIKLKKIISPSSTLEATNKSPYNPQLLWLFSLSPFDILKFITCQIYNSALTLQMSNSMMSEL
jgi:hypothetical protein